MKKNTVATDTFSVDKKIYEKLELPVNHKITTIPFAYDLYLDEQHLYRDDLNYFYYYYPIEGKAKENGITKDFVMDFVSTLMVEEGNTATVNDIYSHVVVPFKEDRLGVIEKVLVSQEMDMRVVSRTIVEHDLMSSAKDLYSGYKMLLLSGLIPRTIGVLATPYVPGILLGNKN